MKEETPFTRQYKALKREAPEGIILLVRMGDFYKAMGEDAVRLSAIFGTTLTRRGGVPMSGCPQRSLYERMYSSRSTGSTFALAETVEFTKRGLCRREIVGIVKGGPQE